jgi:hypothetical protein
MLTQVSHNKVESDVTNKYIQITHVFRHTYRHSDHSIFK